jgi:hypothetical protein
MIKNEKEIKTDKITLILYFFNKVVTLLNIAQHANI